MRLSRIRVMTQSSQRVSRCLTKSPGEAVNEAVKSKWWAAVNSMHLPSASGHGARTPHSRLSFGVVAIWLVGQLGRKVASLVVLGYLAVGIDIVCHSVRQSAGLWTRTKPARVPILGEGDQPSTGAVDHGSRLA